MQQPRVDTVRPERSYQTPRIEQPRFEQPKVERSYQQPRIERSYQQPRVESPRVERVVINNQGNPGWSSHERKAERCVAVKVAGKSNNRLYQT